MSGTSSIGGIVSGLDTDTIITKLIELASQPKELVEAEKTETETQLAAWQSLNTSVLALKTTVDSLAVRDAFNTCDANSSDKTVIQATASTDAVPGTYYLTVNSRAQSHQISALSGSGSTFTSKADTVGTGEITFAFADDPTKDFTISLDSTNNTLTGLCNAINSADQSVQASIINSGTTSNPQYQLLLSSKTTGEASSFTVSADETIDMDFSTVIQQGTDAEIQIGNGGDGTSTITVKKDTNTITDLIEGVTLNVINPDATNTIEISIERDTSGIQTSIQSFVDQYNSLVEYISSQYEYDADTKTSGILMGDWNLQSVQMTLSSIIGGTVGGVDKKFSALATIGITQDTDGYLQINNTTLTKALSNNLDDVRKLFATDMTSDSTCVTYLSSSSSTGASPSTGWDVNITQAARQAQVTAGTALTGTLESDETLYIYTTASKADNAQEIKLNSGWNLSQVISEINTYSDKTGVTAIATKADGTVSSVDSENTYLTLKSVRYGSATDVHAYSNVSNSNSNSSGIGKKLVSSSDASGETGSAVGLVGLDVQGTINGEACKGSGQMLTANPANSNSAINGLCLQITSTAAMSTKIYLTKGVSTMLRDTLVSMTSLNGVISSAQNTLKDKIADLKDDIADLADALTAQEEKLYTQFDAMEAALSELQSQGDYLTQQIKALNSND